jgi:hypothetical protein
LLLVQMRQDRCRFLHQEKVIVRRVIGCQGLPSVKVISSRALSFSCVIGLPHGDFAAGDASASAASVTLSSLMNQKMGRVCKPYSYAGVRQRAARFAASCENIHPLVVGARRTPGDLTVDHRSDILSLTIFNGSKIIV